MEKIKEGWYAELSDDWPGGNHFATSLKVDKIIHHEKTPYQDILFFENAAWGTVLLLDGIINCTTRDECSYQEIITHLPLYSHPNPERVLVIGGGDGGVLREVAKHSCVKEIHICEIDERVIELSKKYLPSMAVGYNDSRVRVHVMDAFIYLKEFAKNLTNDNGWDVIIVDSTDPSGPAEPLFQKEFFELLLKVLRKDGIVSTQAENHWLEFDFVKKLYSFLKDVFPSVEYAYTSVPTYTTGEIGFWILSKNGRPCNKATRKPTEEEQKTLNYYTADIHSAAFALPAFAKRKIFDQN